MGRLSAVTELDKQASTTCKRAIFREQTAVDVIQDVSRKREPNKAVAKAHVMYEKITKAGTSARPHSVKGAKQRIHLRRTHDKRCARIPKIAAGKSSLVVPQLHSVQQGQEGHGSHEPAHPAHLILGLGFELGEHGGSGP